MTLHPSRKTRPTVAVYGAAGHTGRFVISELLRREITPVAIARNAAALTAGNFPEEVLRREAWIDDPESLDRALAGAQAVIHCAGPFLETADAVISAALRARIHYLDISAEQQSVSATLGRYNEAASHAGIAVVPGMGFYGGFADLLVSAGLGDREGAEAIDIMIGLDSWHPTRGTRITGAKNTAPRMVVAERKLTPLTLPSVRTHWEFADPLGHQEMVEVPFSEMILIEKHVKAVELHTYLNSVSLSDVRNPSTPAPKAVDAMGRSAQRFMVDVVLRCRGTSSRISARGCDIYAFTAPLICEMTEHLLEGRFSAVGAQPPGAIVNAHEVLSALTPENLTFEIDEAEDSKSSMTPQ